MHGWKRFGRLLDQSGQRVSRKQTDVIILPHPPPNPQKRRQLVVYSLARYITKNGIQEAGVIRYLGGRYMQVRIVHNEAGQTESA